MGPAGAEWWIEPLQFLAILALASLIVLPHEWLHGLAIRYYCGEPRYGFGVAPFVLPYAYATTDHQFTRNEFVVVCLTPLVVLTLVGVPLVIVFEWGWLVLPLGADSLTVGEPGTPTFLFEYVDTPEEISVSVGAGVLVLGALLGLCYSFLRTYLRVRAPTNGR